jgi:DNA-binding LacI/PurR family transcriptional regulator
MLFLQSIAEEVGGMVQIKDVARVAGVSPSTVSRVLTGAAMVSEENRQRVNDAIAQLGYRPNRIASNFRRQRTHKIGIVIPDIENPTYAESIRVIEEAAFHEGYRVLLCNTDDQPEKQRTYLETLADERVDGIILVPYLSDGRDVSALIDRGLPLVALDRPVADERADAVIADDLDTGRRATQLLIDAGHRDIGFIAGITALKTGSDRLAGYSEVMERHSLRPHIVPGGFKADSAYAAMTQLLDDGEPMSAVIVSSNMMTIGALRAIHERGIAIPGELALVAINDPWWMEMMTPRITAFATPVRRMAESAFDLLLERIEGTRTQSRFVVFTSELHLRESCGTRAIVSDGR